MFKKLLFAIFVFMIASCENKDKNDFSKTKSDFILEYSQLFPDEVPLPTGSNTSDNTSFDYLSEMLIPTSEKMDTINLFLQKYNNAIKEVDAESLAPNDVKDFNKMKGILKTVNLFYEGRQSNPETYNVLYSFQRILNADFSTPENRLQIIFNKLEKVPTFYEAAKSQLKKAEVLKSDETIEKHLKTFQFFEEVLPTYINVHHHLTPQYQARLDAAKYAVKDYVAYVESLRLQ